MASCGHFQGLPAQEPVSHSAGCEECLKTGQRWVHLRKCMVCGHVGCCDSSVGKHATKHFHATGHPVMRSAEPGEDWKYCYIDETFA
jgi:uncharacterized UBP type Zn finger protein